MPGVKSPLRFLLYMLGTAIALLILLCLLPDNRYVRFQSLTDSAVVKVGWIYERIHFDPSPIDVAFIGTSHTVFGINSEMVERTCQGAGGRNCAAVNFGLQHLGRDLHWILAREALETRAPRMLIIEVQESEPRAMHPAFPFLADPGDIVTAPILVNTSYFDDLVRLPLRQMTGFANARAPQLFGVRTQFDWKLYRGSHWDDTYSEKGSIEHPIAQPVPRIEVHTIAELEEERRHLQVRERALLKLPTQLAWIEYRANLLYLKKTVLLARKNGVLVRFLYMPTFHGAPSADFDAFYRKLAPVWQMPRAILNRQDMWLDVGHLNTKGAGAFSKWLGEKIAADGLNH
jgi:hypothetical protein